MKKSRFIRFLLIVAMMAVPGLSKAFYVDGIMYYDYDDLTAAVIHCDNVDTVRIPSHVTYDGKTYTVTSIRDIYDPYWNAYNFCEIVHVSLPNTIKTIEDEAFKEALKLRSIELGDSIITIGASAFEKCWIMDSITIPNTVTCLGKRAFATCWHLSYLDLSGTSINEIGEETFYACMRLESVNLPETLNTIGRDAFVSSGLRHITLPNGLKSLEWGAFACCDSLESVSLPETLTTINDDVFGCCYRLKKLFIPRGVNSIATGFITRCDSLMLLVVDPENQTYDSREGCNAIIRTADNTLIQGSPATIIPEGVTAIGDYAFWAIRIPSTFSLPQSIQSIGNKAFWGDLYQVNVDIPNATQWIGEMAFEGSRSLTSVTLPASLTHIGDKAFRDCEELRTVKAYLTEPVTINENVFETVVENKIYQYATLHVPMGCADKYKAANGWKRFSHIVDDLIVPIPGDVNGDSEVNIGDANTVVVIIINGGSQGHTRPDGTDPADYADINSDGEINIGDLNAIINMILNQ